jgi:hypothetical protein
VLVELRKNDVGQNPTLGHAPPLDDGRGRFVAARFDPENERVILSGIGVRHHLVKFFAGDVGLRVPLEALMSAELARGPERPA